jgi:pilus assembly protein Flp/PilA
MFDKMFITLQILRGSLAERLDREEGATAVEYGLLVALIAAIIVGIVATLGTQIAAAFQTVVDALP